MKHIREKRSRESTLRRVVTVVLSLGVKAMLKRMASAYRRRRAPAAAYAPPPSTWRGGQAHRLVPRARAATTYMQNHPGVVVGLLAGAAGVAFALAASRKS